MWRAATYEPENSDDGAAVMCSRLNTNSWKSVDYDPADAEDAATTYAEQHHCDHDYSEEMEVWVWHDNDLATLQKFVVYAEMTYSFRASAQDSAAGPNSVVSTN